jgi:hypothetical protein
MKGRNNVSDRHEPNNSSDENLQEKTEREMSKYTFLQYKQGTCVPRTIDVCTVPLFDPSSNVTALKNIHNIHTHLDLTNNICILTGRTFPPYNGNFELTMSNCSIDTSLHINQCIASSSYCPLWGLYVICIYLLL